MQTVDVERRPVDDGEHGVGVSRWFGWLDGHVYKDMNGNGSSTDPGEPAIANTDMDQRWRDGSIKEGTFTDPTGYYEYPTAEGGALGRWIVNEQGFARFGVPGASVHDEYRTRDASCAIVRRSSRQPLRPDDLGGALLTNQLLTEGHRATVDWGKTDYPAGTPGQIVGITYFATTRNEFDARFQAHEDYEPAIPDVTVYLETLGPDGLPNTADDVIVNKYVTDHWSSRAARRPPTGRRHVHPGLRGARRQRHDISGQLNPDIGPNCLEVPITGAADQGRRVRRRLRLRRLLPETATTWPPTTAPASAASDPVAAGRRHLHHPRGHADRTPPTRAPATRRRRRLQDVSHAKGTLPGGGRAASTAPSAKRTSTSIWATTSRRPIPPPRAPVTTT